MKTKIMIAGDIHGDQGLVKKLAKKAKKEKVDLIILAGDLTFFETSVKNLIGPFVKTKKQILLLHGNHESIATIDFLCKKYPNTKNLHGTSFSIKETGIFGCGGTDIGANPLTNQEFFKTLKKAHEKIKNKEKKIMITHMHPSKSKAEFSGFKGSEGIRKSILTFKPDIIFSGHIHEAEGIEEKIGKTKVINIGRKGKIFEI